MEIYEEDDLRFYIGESTIPNAGYGLFAKILLKKGDWLEISGILVKKNGIADKCTHYAKRYKFAGSDKLTHKIIPLGYAGIINHIEDESKQNCKIEYVPGLNKRNQHTAQMIYRFIRDVQPDEELLGHYGDKIDLEIKNFNSNVDVIKRLKSDWEVFMGFGLYNLKEKFDLL